MIIAPHARTHSRTHARTHPQSLPLAHPCTHLPLAHALSAPLSPLYAPYSLAAPILSGATLASRFPHLLSCLSRHLLFPYSLSDEYGFRKAPSLKLRLLSVEPALGTVSRGMPQYSSERGLPQHSAELGFGERVVHVQRGRAANGSSVAGIGVQFSRYRQDSPYIITGLAEGRWIVCLACVCVFLCVECLSPGPCVLLSAS